MTAVSSTSDRVTKLVRLCVLLSAALVISLIATALAVRAANGNKIAVIAIDSRGNTIPAVPLDKAYINEPRVVAFAEECVRRAYSHDFLHYGETMVNAQDCFTSDSAAKYATSMQSYFKIMDEKRMNMAVVIRRPAQVTRTYLLDGVVHWDLQIEVDISFEGRAERIPATKYRIDMSVRRIPLEEAARGVAITTFTTGPSV